MSERTLAAVRVALGEVYDPCSLAARAPLSVLEMGLVREFKVDDGVAHITLSTTFPGCVLVGSILQAVEEKVAAVPGVKSVELSLDHTTVWTPELMTAEAHRTLEATRQESIRRVPVRPRQWMEAPTRVPAGEMR